MISDILSDIRKYKKAFTRDDLSFKGEPQVLSPMKWGRPSE